MAEPPDNYLVVFVYYITYLILFWLLFVWRRDFVDVYWFGGENRGLEKNIWEVLVGAFSDFGDLDTDNPVQISLFFRVFSHFRFPEGLI